MDCSDQILLQRLLDGDLDEVQAELVSHHVDSCIPCRATMKEVSELRSFVQNQLGAEDEGEEGSSAATLAAISSRLSIAETPRPSPSRWWSRPWLIAATVAALALLAPVPFLSELRAWPSEILEEAATRERVWKFRPGKILHWEVETTTRGVKDIADGQWRTMFWQKNGAETFTQISRQFDPQGRTETAYWQQDDGSVMRYRSRGNVLEISPSTTAAREALPTLPPPLRETLQAYVTRRETVRRLDFNGRHDVQMVQRPWVWESIGKATFRRGLIDAWGEVYHITVVDERPVRNPSILRVVHEYDVESSSFRLLRLKTTLTYADGTTGLHDSRWKDYREISEAEYEAQAPRDLLASGIPVVRLTPLQIAERELQNTNRSAIR